MGGRRVLFKYGLCDEQKHLKCSMPCIVSVKSVFPLCLSYLQCLESCRKQPIQPPVCGPQIRQRMQLDFNALANLPETLEHFTSVYSRFIAASERGTGFGGGEVGGGVVVVKSTPCDGKNYEFVNYGGDERETRAREEMHALLLMRAK